MERKDAQEVEIERLAEIKAKRRLDSWSERFKATWCILLVPWSVIGFFALLWMWIQMSVKVDGHWYEILQHAITNERFLDFWFPILIIGGVGWFFYYKHEAWKKKRLREFYEEELLELKMKSKGESNRDEAPLTNKTSPSPQK